MHPFYEVRKKDYSVKNNRNEVTFNPHIHSDIEILYIRSGIQHLQIEEKNYALAPGEAAVIFPNVMHRYCCETTPAASIDAVLIICSKRFYRNFFPDMTDWSPSCPVISKKNIHPDAEYAFQNINDSLPANLKMAWIIIILTHLLEYLSLSQTQKPPVEDISFKLIEYIDEHFTESLTLDQIADALCVSKNYVSRVFSKKIKMSFRKYLGILRAEYAANLLRTTNYKMTRIAETAGFESLSTFNRIFREIYGMSPREFRTHLEQYGKSL